MKFIKNDLVVLNLTDRSAKVVKIVELHPGGISAVNVNLLNPTLTFFPYTNIISISKYQIT